MLRKPVGQLAYSPPKSDLIGILFSNSAAAYLSAQSASLFTAKRFSYTYSWGRFQSCVGQQHDLPHQLVVKT